MSKKNKKGRGIFYFFLILAALGGVFVAGFPVVEAMFPDIAQKVHDFRGYYSGPLFIAPQNNAEDYFTEEYHGFKSVMVEEQIFHFIPAADISFYFSGYYDNYSGNLLNLDLYEADKMESVIATNLTVPYETGRQVSAATQQGLENPEHANWFTFMCSKGTHYALKVSPKRSQDIGTEFIVKIDIAEAWISLPELWGMFVGILFFILITSIILKFIWSVRRKSS